MHPGGHRISLPINQNRALTPDGLGDQRAPAPGCTVEQHGRVELDELEIADRNTRPHRQCDAITRRTLGVGGRGVEMAQSPGRQDHRRRVHDAEPVVAEHEHTGHRAIGLEQLERDVIAPDVQPGRGVVERPLHLGTRRIAAGVDDPASRMSALAGERPLSRRRLVEPRAVVDQFGDRAVAVGHDRAHRIRIAQPGTRGERIGDVLVDRILGVGQHDGDPALCVEGRRIAGLAQHHHFSAAAMRRQRRDEARNAGADDDDVGTLLPIAADRRRTQSFAAAGRTDLDHPLHAGAGQPGDIGIDVDLVGALHQAAQQARQA